MVASGKAEKVKPPVFTALELARGWRILRQHLQLSVHLENRTLSGTAHFTFSAINNQFVSIALNLRRCRVTSCRINGLDAPYRLVSPLDDDELLAAVSHDTARHRIDDIEYSMQIRDNAASTQGELVIDLPASVSADIIDELKEVLMEYRASVGKEKDIDEELEPDAAIPVPLSQLPLVNLTVEYETLDPTAGAIYYGDLNAPVPVRDPLYMLTDSRFGMSRFWMPCLDTKNWCDRYLFDIDVAVKPNLTVVASGELTDTLQYESEDIPETKVFKYRLHAPAHASEIVVAVGPFIALPDPTLSSKVTHFCLPGLAKELVYTAPPIFAKALAFCREYLGGDPPSCSFKQLFVGSLGMRADVTRAGAGGIVVHSGDLLHTARCIDEGLIAREAIVNGLVMSYFGRFLRPRIAEDDWLISGLASHVSALGLQAILGSNWYRFRIADLMNQLCTEESCDLSNTKTRQIPDVTIEAVRRRSHVIVYMIERRIGSEVMKRALRDIVAEGKSATTAAVKVICLVLSKSQHISGSDVSGFEKSPTPELRELTDFNGAKPSSSGTTSVVSTGFEDAIQGVGVGPFLKRIRAIVGTDVRSMVRLWAASPGVPRLRVGYQYNARKHAIEFAVKQEGVIRGEKYSGRPGLPFTGSVNIRVMEVEGVYDHNIEISDALFSTELQCHSRRAKTTKPTVPGEKDMSDTSRSPVLWIRFDPENDWCIDYTFPQTKDSWIALLKGERDAMAQYEACQGLSGCDDEASTKALSSIAGDDKIYWRVRVEAAKALASTEKGLEMLLVQFRSSYMDGDEGLLRPCNFADIANYFVKRGFIASIAGARVKSPTSLHPEGSIPVAATKFLPSLLSGHDNTGNQFDDDHYLVDLLQAAAKAAVYCVGDQAHANAGEDGGSTTESIVRQLERFRSIEAMVPRRTDLVRSGISSALTAIEIACMMRKDAKSGAMSAKMLSGRFEHNSSLTGNIFELCDRHISFDSRLAAVSDLVKVYGGDLDVLMWVLARLDTVSSGDNIIEIEMSEENYSTAHYGYYEPPAFRYQLMDAMIEAASTKGWGGSAAPLVLALRRNTSRAMQVCVRLLRLIVGEADPRIRSSALRFAKIVWGAAVPVCLLGRAEYVEAKNLIRIGDRIPPKSIVPLKLIEGVLPPQGTDLSDAKASKPAKVTKSSKHSKTGKPPRTSVKLLSSPPPDVPMLIEPSRLQKKPVSTVIDVDRPIEAANGSEGKLLPKAPRIPKSVPKPEVIAVDQISLPNLRSVPLSMPSEQSRPRLRFSWEPLDEEDVRLLRRAWEERNIIGNEAGGPYRREGHYGSEMLSEGHMVADNGQERDESRSGYHDVSFLGHDGGEHSGAGIGSEHKKKKKKKKRKRHHDDESGQKKKKKKKKKREGNADYLDVDGEGASPEEPPPESRKIGKFKIRLGGSSLPHVARSE